MVLGLFLIDLSIMVAAQLKRKQENLDIAIIEQLESLTVGKTVPDLTLWLDVEPQLGLQRAAQRAAKDRIESETLHFFERIREGYGYRHSLFPERIKKIDANNSLQTVSEHIATILRQYQHWFKP